MEPIFANPEAAKDDPHGLTAAYGIARAAGGDLWIYSEPGRGTTFKAFLPRMPDNQTIRTKTVSARKTPTGTETVLLVEDEETLRTVVQLFLQGWGYHVLLADNGEEAIRVSDAYGAPVHLLLTDIVMPRLTGPELYDQLHPKRPEMKVLFTSGFTEAVALQQGYLKPGAKFVQKPSSADVLARAVRDALDA
jgi:CheY-like chemotaxis protein